MTYMFAVIVNFFFHLLGHDIDRRADNARHERGFNHSIMLQIDDLLEQLEVDLAAAVEADDTREVYTLLAQRDSLDRRKLAATSAMCDANYELVSATAL